MLWLSLSLFFVFENVFVKCLLYVLWQTFRKYFYSIVIVSMYHCCCFLLILIGHISNLVEQWISVQIWFHCKVVFGTLSIKFHFSNWQTNHYLLFGAHILLMIFAIFRCWCKDYKWKNALIECGACERKCQCVICIDVHHHDPWLWIFPLFIRVYCLHKYV